MLIAQLRYSFISAHFAPNFDPGIMSRDSSLAYYSIANFGFYQKIGLHLCGKP